MRRLAVMLTVLTVGAVLAIGAVAVGDPQPPAQPQRSAWALSLPRMRPFAVMPFLDRARPRVLKAISPPMPFDAVHGATCFIGGPRASCGARFCRTYTVELDGVLVGGGKTITGIRSSVTNGLPVPGGSCASGAPGATRVSLRP